MVIADRIDFGHLASIELQAEALRERLSAETRRIPGVQPVTDEIVRRDDPRPCLRSHAQPYLSSDLLPQEEMIFRNIVGRRM